MRWLKPVLSSRVAELRARRTIKEGLPRMDEEVARLGRSASARVTVPADAAGATAAAGKSPSEAHGA
jgi:hypothetical protein